MGDIRGVKQRYEWDCAVATVAMASNAAYADVLRLARARFGRITNRGIHPAGQIQLLEELTNEPWGFFEHTTPNGMLLPVPFRDFKLTIVDADEDTESNGVEPDIDASDTRFLLSVAWKQEDGAVSRHSLFTDGRRVWCPGYGEWYPFSLVRRLPWMRNRVVRGLVVPVNAWDASRTIAEP